jgi:hypothetical protein
MKVMRSGRTFLQKTLKITLHLYHRYHIITCTPNLFFNLSCFVAFYQLALKAAGVVRTLDESDELAFLRVRSKKHEIMIAPDKEYILVVVQTPNEA